MKIIHATHRDLDHVAPLFDLYRQFYGQSTDIPGAKSFLADRLRSKDSVVFLALGESGEPLGFVQLYPSYSSVAMKRLWILNDLFVDVPARRSGVAEALLQQCVALARETKSAGLMLETGRQNKAAQQLYRKLGWKEEKEFLTYRLDS